MSKIVLVSCVGKKQATPTKAADFYQSTWFKKARSYAELVGDQWHILSAHYGLISPEKVIKPYELTLNSMPIDLRKDWAWTVWEDIECEFDPTGNELIVLAGLRYREFLVPLLRGAAFGWIDEPSFTVQVPMEGLKIGQQLQWLSSEISRMAKVA